MLRTEPSMRLVFDRAPPGCRVRRWRPDAQARRSHRRLRLGEQVRELRRELVGAVAAHRVAGDRGPVGVELVARGDVGPHLERVGARIVVVPAVGAAALGSDHDRPGPALAELRLVVAGQELVVVRRPASAAAASARNRRPASAAAGRRSRRAAAVRGTSPGIRSWSWSSSAAEARRLPVKLKAAPCSVSKWLARMRFIGPVCGTPPGWPGMSSSTCAASLLKSTLAKNWLMSPVVSACACAFSRHQAGSLTALGLWMSGIGSLKRKATL